MRSFSDFLSWLTLFLVALAVVRPVQLETCGKRQWLTNRHVGRRCVVFIRILVGKGIERIDKDLGLILDGLMLDRLRRGGLVHLWSSAATLEMPLDTALGTDVLEHGGAANPPLYVTEVVGAHAIIGLPVCLAHMAPGGLDLTLDELALVVGNDTARHSCWLLLNPWVFAKDIFHKSWKKPINFITREPTVIRIRISNSRPSDRSLASDLA